MCLILFAWRSHPQHRLLVAANRDEFYRRPALPAHWWDDAPHILAGRDLEQGGTWLGVTNSGRFAALTNVRNPVAAAGPRSRGQLVRDFLDSTLSPAAFLAQLQPALGLYSPFNLLLGDGEQLHYANHHGEWRELQPGVYGLSNATLDTPWPKVVTGKQQLAALMTREPQPGLLFDMLADRTEASDDELPDTGIDRALERTLSARFIHSDGYGTRCSTVLMQSHHGSITLYERQYNQHGQCDQTCHHEIASNCTPLPGAN
jgi:uncharacterized protein with NRDE domain